MSCDTEGIRFFLFLCFIFNIIFTFYLHIFVYILSPEPVQTDITRSSLKPVFFCPTLLFSARLLVKKKTTARLPHVYRTCGCAVNLPHNRTCGEVSLGYIVNLSDFYFCRIIGKLTVFFAASGVQLAQSDRGYFSFLRAAFASLIKSHVVNILDKAETLRITLNLDGEPITSKSHTHPSHSQIRHPTGLWARPVIRYQSVSGTYR